jgi:hypothetical protein
MNISVHQYSDQDLTQARHTYELKRCDETILNLDWLQSGLGSNSCGPGPLEEYLIKPQKMAFSVRLRAFSKDAFSPMFLSKYESAGDAWLRP